MMPELIQIKCFIMGGGLMWIILRYLCIYRKPTCYQITEYRGWKSILVKLK